MVTIQFERGDLNEQFLDGAEGVLVLAISNGKFDLSSNESRVLKWTYNLINQLRNAVKDEEHHAGIFTELRIDVPINDARPGPAQDDKVVCGRNGGKAMELKDTIELMCSDDWKDRFVAEYLQVKIRYEKLHRLIIKRELGKCDFDTPIPLQSWKDQAFHMGMYLYELEKQAVLHGIDLPQV